MTQKQKKLIIALAVFASANAVVPAANAMHIMEGYLPLAHCILWMVICIPFLVIGLLNIKKTLGEDRRTLMLLALTGAFVFVLSSLKIPSLTGSCSHMTGAGLGAILFGPFPVVVLGLIVLLFQALLLAHGGITTLGANTFSMAVAGPLLAWGIYRGCQKLHINRKVSIFLAAALGDLFTYCVTSLQLALAYPSPMGGVGASMVKFLVVFAPTQLPLAIIEGLLTTATLLFLESFALPELQAIGYKKEV